MNRSSDEVAVQTAMCNYVSTAKNSKLKKFQYQEILKDMTNDYDLHSEDIILPNDKEENTPLDLVLNDDLTENERKQMMETAKQFPLCFGSENKTKVKTRHHIRTDCEPVRSGIPRLSPEEIKMIRTECEKMLLDDKIEPSKSDWRSAVVLIPKPDGSVRFCVNYKQLNKHTKFDAYPLPNLQSLLSNLHGAKYFISLDLKSGYWQINLAEKDKEKTAFVTPFGLYQFKVMPFGLSTAPATFQRLMNEIFDKMIGKDLLIYLDDLLIFASTFEEILGKFKGVLSKLEEHGLTLNAKKCRLGMTRINFLGFKVTEMAYKPATRRLMR
eukprot:NODE_743_length_4284_cov_0.513501.p1 type:complete len:326 gc:universal NODE_743_length_4284_cov_0.513501:3845-2868(-)